MTIDRNAGRRIVTSETGGQKETRDIRPDLVPVGPWLEVCRHYGIGAAKYEDHNWRRGYEWSLAFQALMRHALAFWAGEDRDEETGTHHMAAVVFHALTLIEFGDTHPELDDRWITQNQLRLDVAEDQEGSEGDASDDYYQPFEHQSPFFQGGPRILDFRPVALNQEMLDRLMKDLFG